MIKKMLAAYRPYFEKGGRFEKLYPFWEATETFFYTPPDLTGNDTHIRDGLDLKRVMTTVYIAVVPCILMALYNTGLQANLAIETLGADFVPEGWRYDLLKMLGVGFDTTSLGSNVMHGAVFLIPVIVVTYTVGLFWEALFASVRGHGMNEGFFVTGILFPLILPPSIPLWQVALGITFGVVVGKELFGGTGRNFLNPALTARAFVFFAYPAQLSGASVWTAVDGYSGATALAVLANSNQGAADLSWMDHFIGTIPGSMGETSTLACLIGAVILIVTGIGSWRIMLSVAAGMAATALLFNVIGSETNTMFAMSPAWHLVTGGFAFGAVYMATDPVSACMTHHGKYFYGLLIGIMVVLVRVVNPAFPEGMMLSILFANCFAPLIDHLFLQRNIKRRLARSAV